MALISIRCSELVAIVDDRDVDLVGAYKWYAQPKGRTRRVYANRRPGKGTFRLHQLILGFPGSSVDHRNGNGLDNRRENLRLATHTQNMRNFPPTGSSSKYKGVVWKQNKRWPSCSKWYVRIAVDGKRLDLGTFRDEEEAARAYDAAAAAHFGEFARLNFPVEVNRGY